MAHPAQTENSAKETLDKPRRKQCLAGIAQCEDERAPKVSVAEKVRNEGCAHRAYGYRQPRTRSESNQRARGYARCRPKHGDAVGEEYKAQPRGYEIGE